MKTGRMLATASLLSMVPLLLLLPGCRGDEARTADDPVSSRSYRGHEDDTDADNLVTVYPALVGTRLDDCQTCHTGRIEQGRLAGSSCDHCHDLVLHGSGHDFVETLNPFGLDYLRAGRSTDALEAIRKRDSDEDGFTNDEELLAQRYPGSDASRPGQATATLITITLDELKALPSHTQLMLSNTSRQQFDDYVIYKGVKVADLIDALGVDLAGATGITLIAPDGYMKSLPIETVDRVFPQPLFYVGLDVEALGPDCALATYPAAMPDGLTDGSFIPGEHRLLLGYERNGVELDTAYLDVERGKIQGDGPLRAVVPQATPGRPDRGSKYSPSGCGDEFDYREDADHNAGAMVRGVVAIRIDPMPAGVEEFDFMNGGWAYIDAGQLIVYGHGVP
jgi:hypothetical protein